MNEPVGRRRFLFATAGAGTIAGCTSSDLAESPSNETPETSDASVSTEIGRVSAALQYVRPTRSERRPEVLATDGGQYVIVTVGERTIDASDVVLRLDDTEYTDTFTANRDGRLHVGFEVPQDVAAENGTALVGEARHPIYRDVLDRLADPPRFTNVSFDARAEIRPGAIMGLDVRIWNRGGPGPFTAVFDVPDAQPSVFSEQVDSGTFAGYTTHVTIDDDAESGGRTAVFDTGFERYTVPYTIVSPAGN
ncbi:hypothetical protein [Natrinema halophilum]|uniref:Uncharacterized protein n=1 Tax=Natrinema halophilum TaxID=1699371 RepID=A0A7D5KK33_9EURY|nr:hypothetical protein [Natrinema halophilum]QLG50019.1 hypothetical protein HYG82_14715 [Natrinema halophilum]